MTDEQYTNITEKLDTLYSTVLNLVSSANKNIEERNRVELIELEARELEATAIKLEAQKRIEAFSK